MPTHTDRQRALLVTRNLPPLVGGMERLVWHIANALRSACALHVIGPTGCAAHLPAGVTATEVALEPMPRFLAGVQLAAFRQALRLRPGWVLAGSGLTAPMAWLAARVCGARAAVYVHGLDVAVPHPMYQRIWPPFLRRMDRVIANSRATAELTKKVGVPQERIAIVHPGVALPPEMSSTDRSELRRRFRQRYGLGEDPVLLSVGRLTTRKGILEFVRDVLPQIARQVSEVQLVVIGGEPTKALYARGQSVDAIRAVARRVGMVDRVVFLGEVTRWESLREAYIAADVHVFPIRKLPDDPEGFGMVAVEAAAHGLATVAYASGGVVDAVSDGVSGRLIPPGGFAAFAQAVLELLQNPLPREPIEEFARGFAWEAFGARIRDALLS